MSNDDTTGSISRPVALVTGLDGDDQRRAADAMETALDPAANGMSVAWTNPESGSHGSFSPVAASYPRAKMTCRTFLAEVAVKGATEKSLQGTACRLSGGRWFIRDVKPWTG